MYVYMYVRMQLLLFHARTDGCEGKMDFSAVLIGATHRLKTPLFHQQFRFEP